MEAALASKAQHIIAGGKECLYENKLPTNVQGMRRTKGAPRVQGTQLFPLLSYPADLPLMNLLSSSFSLSLLFATLLFVNLLSKYKRWNHFCREGTAWFYQLSELFQ